MKKPFPVFGGNFTGDVIGLFSPLVFFVLLYVFAYLWALDRHIAYNQYTKEELPSAIKVKAVNDRIIQVLLLIFFWTFLVWLFWGIVQYFIGQRNGEDRPFITYIGITLLVGFILASVYDFTRNYRGTFYALEIRNESLYIFNKETLIDTISLDRIHHIHFFMQKQGKSTRIHPRMQVYTSKIERILHIKLSIDNYHLLKTFFYRKQIKVIDEYSSRSKK
ncbi:hypothetical protein [Capnocytophaga gingivalis]|uniref:hypothetical protein n=1 Tax=Capnocytophaga gingivalis TaxID=1017 RepID=UPI0028D8724C|nr:hypothetical protein [Capnocytophaga gingivalis]